LRWLVVDGFGFHEGYFRPRAMIHGKRTPALSSLEARRAFDEGLGRALWFVECADGPRVAARISTFASARQQDLWAGVGLAATYAGGCNTGTLQYLRNQSGEWVSLLAQGSAFAAKARQLAGLQAPHSDHACEILCGCSSSVAASVCDREHREMIQAGIPDYQLWRAKTAGRLSAFAAAPR
jgi:hypothetical protein